MKFIQRSEQFSTLEKPVCAPCFRRSFVLEQGAEQGILQITGLGFYDVYVNGQRITKGFLAPYRSNLDHYVYYDEYPVAQVLRPGKNVIACIAGNGWKNPVGGFTWGFDKAHWRGAPQVAFCLNVTCKDGSRVCIESDEKTRTADSPILFDDLHFGEYYDARLEKEGWEMPDFDDSDWTPAQVVQPPLGELRRSFAEPIVASGALKPVSVTPYENGYIYDFGQNNSGLCRLKIRGSRGQKLVMQYFETLRHGRPFLDTCRFRSQDRFQEDEYICSGNQEECYMPRFTYHGFRYVYVTGITPEQATKDLLTYVLLHSDIPQIGYFECDDPVVNQLQAATLRSDISNFHYFPTDCPQREKNGWTADASLSAEQMLLNFDPQKSYTQWFDNIVQAMTEEGELPGIIPTAGWGYTPKGGQAHNGPAWDSVLVNLPYYTYLYRGNTQLLQASAKPIEKYLAYLEGKMDERGLLAIGLGDWCQPRRSREGDYATPLVVTDSIVAADIAAKAACIFKALHMEKQQSYAQALFLRLKKAVRRYLIDPDSLQVLGNTQTGQAIAIAYGMFEQGEKEKALANLLSCIEEKEGFMDTGVIGARVIFRVLAENGYFDLAYHMITRLEYPSYGNWIARGATTLWEGFWEEDASRYLSMNHHFWGDISAWFYTFLAGIHLEFGENGERRVRIAPCFAEKLNWVKASYELPEGKLTVCWKREAHGLVLEVTAPSKAQVQVDAPGAQWTVCVY